MIDGRVYLVLCFGEGNFHIRFGLCTLCADQGELLRMILYLRLLLCARLSRFLACTLRLVSCESVLAVEFGIAVAARERSETTKLTSAMNYAKYLKNKWRSVEKLCERDVSTFVVNRLVKS